MNNRRASARNVRLPREPIARVIEPITRFMHVESHAGLVLLFFTVLALILANSPASEWYFGLWNTHLGFRLGEFEVDHSLKHWINDGLMVIFFFVVGLEIKRELAIGELRDLRTASLPVAAAIGGMVVPAGIYLLLQSGEEGESGWGVPMATDIAFVVGCLALLGDRVPRSLRIMLLSLAIVDDVGAVLVIAIGYTENVGVLHLLFGFVGMGIVMMAARLGVRNILFYVVLGAGIWLLFHESGVHATVAGMILGLLTPVRPWVSKNLLSEFIHQAGEFLHGSDWQNTGDRKSVLRSMERAARETISPLERLEFVLHPWVSYLIMPLFAFANAGVLVRPEEFTNPIAVAIVTALVIGKPLGVLAFSWLAVRAGVARLPESVTWKLLSAASILTGIGFTMSLFIAGLALEEQLLNPAKLGVLAASVVCAALGMFFLSRALPPAVSRA